ncbi:MAG: TPM domain-containing protein [Ignavibacteriales bacterium]|nr:TPM domain-containing protein [Ignavibacteriales bacterium]
MINKYRSLFISFILIFIGTVTLTGQEEIPIVHARVNDQTGTFSSGEISNLENTLFEFENETSNQIVVLMIISLDGKDIKDFAYNFAEKNKIGKKDRNNGVLLLIAKEDRKIDIEVGYGLEGVLTDAVSGQIIRKIIGPRFREGDFYGGVSDGLQAIMSATKGEFKGDPKRNHIKTFSPIAIILLILFFGIFPRIFGRGRRSAIGSQGYSSSFPWWGGGFGGGGFGGGGGFSGGGGSFGGGGASGSW